MNQSVKLVWITPDAEKLIAYCARVSSPNQENESYEGLIKYLIDHKHWSPFEMASMCVEIITSRAIGRQILRHRSFSFQEFSQRYSSVPDFVEVRPRRQAKRNRQSSSDDLDRESEEQFRSDLGRVQGTALETYQRSLDNGVAKESARFLLPETSLTKMYMAGTIRSWVHYLQIRLGDDVQQEHREIAMGIQGLMMEHTPTIAEFT